MEGLCYFRGQWHKASNFHYFSPDQQIWGDCVFTTQRSYHQKFPFWRDHMERFKLHAFYMTTRMPKDLGILESFVFNFIDKQQEDFVLKIALRAQVQSFKDIPSEVESWAYLEPIKTETHELETLGISRFKRGERPFSVKAPFPELICELRNSYYDDLLILDDKDRVLEATTSNIFWREKGEIFTPPEGPNYLCGITRKYICEIKKVKSKELYYKNLDNIDELFLTNNVRGIIPVKEIFINHQRKSLECTYGREWAKNWRQYCFRKKSSFGQLSNLS